MEFRHCDWHDSDRVSEERSRTEDQLMEFRVALGKVLVAVTGVGVCAAAFGD